MLRKLLAPSGYKISDLAPENIAAKTGSDILHKFGPEVLLELQKWLDTHGLELKVSEAKEPHELAAVEQAILVLNVYGISIDVTRSSLSLLRGIQADR